MAATINATINATEDARIVRSRMKVLDAATSILTECGPMALTVEAVSERSGVAKSTIYRIWTCRNDIVLDVVRRARPSITPPTTDNFADALRDLLQQAMATMQSPEWARIMPILASLQFTMPDVSEVVRADAEDHLDAINAVLKLGIAEGRFPDGVDADIVAYLLAGPLVLATIKGRVDDLATIAAAVTEQFLAAHPPRPA